MIGRKRCDENEKVNLWVFDIDKSKAEDKYSACLDLLNWFYEYDDCNDDLSYQNFATKIWNSKNEKLFILFRLHKGHVFENYLARHVLARKADIFKEISEGETSFKEIVCDWLGKDHILLVKKIDVLKQFIELNKCTLIDEEKQSELRSLIVEANIEEGNNEPQKSRVEKLDTSALSNRLEKLEIPFIVKSFDNFWILLKKDVNN